MAETFFIDLLIFVAAVCNFSVHKVLGGSSKLLFLEVQIWIDALFNIIDSISAIGFLNI